jgi:hypothetical protein
MRRIKIIKSIFILFFVLAGCRPDLTVNHIEVDSWIASDRKVHTTISNVGDSDASEFLVYFDVTESLPSTNHIPQVRKHLGGLPVGGITVINADFTPLAHPDNNSLANITNIKVTVDSKGMVNEKNETNNDMEIPVP